MSPRRQKIALVAALLALAGVFLAWSAGRGHLATALAVFVAPPVLLAMGVAAGSRMARFAAGVMGLAWFCHGVMEAWSEPASRALAWLELLLAVVIVFLASWPGVAARLGRRPGGRHVG